MPDDERVKWIAASCPTPVVTVVASILMAYVALGVHKTFAASILGYLFLKGDIPGAWNNWFRGPIRPREEQLIKLYGLIYHEPHQLDGAEARHDPCGSPEASIASSLGRLDDRAVSKNDVKQSSCTLLASLVLLALAGCLLMTQAYLRT